MSEPPRLSILKEARGHQTITRATWRVVKPKEGTGARIFDQVILRVERPLVFVQCVRRSSENSVIPRLCEEKLADVR